MKLSDFGRVHKLANERRHAMMVLCAIEVGADVDLTVGGWNVGLDEAAVEKLMKHAAQEAENDIRIIEAALAALGVEVDIPREAYTERDLPEWESGHDDDEEGDEHEPQAEAEAGEVTNAAA